MLIPGGPTLQPCSWPSGGTGKPLSCFRGQVAVRHPAQGSLRDAHSDLLSGSAAPAQGTGAFPEGPSGCPAPASQFALCQELVEGRGQESPGLLPQAQGESLAPGAHRCPEETRCAPREVPPGQGCSASAAASQRPASAVSQSPRLSGPVCTCTVGLLRGRC